MSISFRIIEVTAHGETIAVLGDVLIDGNVVGRRRAQLSLYDRAGGGTGVWDIINSGGTDQQKRQALLALLTEQAQQWRFSEANTALTELRRLIPELPFPVAFDLAPPPEIIVPPEEPTASPQTEKTAMEIVSHMTSIEEMLQDVTTTTGNDVEWVTMNEPRAGWFRRLIDRVMGRDG